MITFLGITKPHFVAINTDKGLVDSVMCVCVKCCGTVTIIMPEDTTVQDLGKWWTGQVLVQNSCFSSIDVDEREIAISGYCSSCYDSLFQEED